jgi:hypothetical protein
LAVSLDRGRPGFSETGWKIVRETLMEAAMSDWVEDKNGEPSGPMDFRHINLHYDNKEFGLEPKPNYDHIKCPICGYSWDHHGQDSPNCVGKRPADNPELNKSDIPPA